MRITRFYATAKAKAHMLSKHDVEWYEVADIMYQRLSPRRISAKGDERRYYVKGQTEDGRYLKVIFALEPPDTARIITAFPER